MARSHHIYVILSPVQSLHGEPAYTVIAAFTVKHECESFLRRTCLNKTQWVVHRHRDGGALDGTYTPCWDKGVNVKMEALKDDV